MQRGDFGGLACDHIVHLSRWGLDDELRCEVVSLFGGELVGHGCSEFVSWAAYQSYFDVVGGGWKSGRGRLEVEVNMNMSM